MFVLHIPNTQLKLSLEVNVSKTTSITTSQIIVLHLPKLLSMEISHNILQQFKIFGISKSEHRAWQNQRDWDNISQKKSITSY